MSNQDITFDKFNLSAPLLDALNKKGFKVASEIQAKVIPVALEGKRDIVGIAQTGTGKTAAFGLPIIEKISEESGFGKIPKSIILAPTRELAIQVSEELKTYSGTKRIKTLAVYGGQAIGPQIKDLRRGTDIVVGTPGRVLDLINRGNLNLENIEYFVLDEADEMLKMGFIEDIEQILEASKNKEKRVFLFSATMPDKIKNLSKKYMRNQEIIEVQKREDNSKLITQIYYVLKQSERFDAIRRIIDAENFFYGIVFCRTKSDVDDLTNNLRKAGYDADCIHGDIIQSKRERILNKFRDLKINILVATDVAARGIDVENLTHVINYSLPKETETYVHRIGRTGRAGKEGIAISFIGQKEKYLLNEIEKITKSKFKNVKLPNKADIEVKKQEKFFVDIQTFIASDEASKYLDKADELIDRVGSREAVSALIGMLEKKGAKKESSGEESRGGEFRSKRESRDRGESRDRESRGRKETRGRDSSRSGSIDKGEVRLFIAKGQMDGYHKGNLLGFLEKEAKINSLKGKDVKVCEKFSFITVSNDDANKILDVFESKKGRPLVEVASR